MEVLGIDLRTSIKKHSYGLGRSASGTGVQGCPVISNSQVHVWSALRNKFDRIFGRTMRSDI